MRPLNPPTVTRLSRNTLSDDELLRVLRTCPRATTHQVQQALREDLNIWINASRLRQHLHRLVLARKVGRTNRGSDRAPAYRWWVL